MRNLICYCFGYSADDIHQDYTKNGKSTIMEKIQMEKKFGNCQCATKNPKGRWCLADVHQVVDRLKGEGAKSVLTWDMVFPMGESMNYNIQSNAMTILFFTPETQWLDTPPLASHWMHQLTDSWATKEMYRTGIDLRNELFISIAHLLMK